MHHTLKDSTSLVPIHSQEGSDQLPNSANVTPSRARSDQHISAPASKNITPSNSDTALNNLSTQSPHIQKIKSRRESRAELTTSNQGVNIRSTSAIINSNDIPSPVPSNHNSNNNSIRTSSGKQKSKGNNNNNNSHFELRIPTNYFYSGVILSACVIVAYVLKNNVSNN